jgi:hypothetical protein
VDGTGSGSCGVVGFGISDVEPSDSNRSTNTWLQDTVTEQ